MKYVIGIDGGGTKTVGYIGNIQCEILGAAVAGPSNYHSVGLEETKRNIDLVIKRLIQASQIHIDDVCLISFGLAGVGRPEDEVIIKGLLKELNLDKKFILSNDAIAALVGAHGKAEGIVTISGTGSISLGIDIDGNMVRVGGWGHIFDDEGSGYDIGKMVLSSVFKAFDGRGKDTILTKAVLEYLGIKSVDYIIRYVYDALHNKERIAKLAPLALKGALEGDEISIHILERAADSLVLMTQTVIEKLNNNVNEICFIGGIFENFKYLTDYTIKKLKEHSANIIIKNKLFDAGVGALLLGWIYLGLRYDVRKIKSELEVRNYDRWHIN